MQEQEFRSSRNGGVYKQIGRNDDTLLNANAWRDSERAYDVKPIGLSLIGTNKLAVLSAVDHLPAC